MVGGGDGGVEVGGGEDGVTAGLEDGADGGERERRGGG